MLTFLVDNGPVYKTTRMMMIASYRLLQHFNPLVTVVGDCSDVSYPTEKIWLAQQLVLLEGLSYRSYFDLKITEMFRYLAKE